MVWTEIQYRHMWRNSVQHGWSSMSQRGKEYWATTKTLFATIPVTVILSQLLYSKFICALQELLLNLQLWLFFRKFQTLGNWTGRKRQAAGRKSSMYGISTANPCGSSGCWLENQLSLYHIVSLVHFQADNWFMEIWTYACSNDDNGTLPNCLWGMVSALPQLTSFQ